MGVRRVAAGIRGYLRHKIPLHDHRLGQWTNQQICQCKMFVASLHTSSAEVSAQATIVMCGSRVRHSVALLLAVALAYFPTAHCWGGLAGLAGVSPGAPGSGVGGERNLPKLSRHLRYVLYPDTATMGLFLAIAIPLDLPNKDVSLSWNFEANYYLPPYNTSLYAPGTVLLRDAGSGRGRRERGAAMMDRTSFYELVESHLHSEGLPGRACLLRAICEAAETPLRHNGLVGDLLHVLLTPSTSEDEGLSPEFAEAETRGAAGGDCARAHGAACPASVLDLVSVLV